MAREFGIKGEIAVVKLLCAIYRNGYFYEWNEETRDKLLGELPTVSEGCLNDIVARLVRWGFFDKTLFHSAHVLTSAGIQKRYFAAVKRRSKGGGYPHLLVDVDELLHAETPFLHTETPFLHTETPQKKIETKVSLNPPPPPRVYASVREETAGMEANAQWVEQVCMRFHLQPDGLSAALNDFAADCECRGRTVHNNLADAQSHFISWMMRRNDFKTKRNATDSNRRTAADNIADAQRAGIEETERFVREAARARGGFPAQVS